MQKKLIKTKQKAGIIAKRIKKNLFGGATIILYHRVDSPKEDPLMLCVSPENFKAQLKFLKEKYKIIFLSELVNKIQKKESLRGYIVVTFDDGYLDNLDKALPILEELQIPATIFIVSGKIDSKEPFFWDKDLNKEDAGIPLQKENLQKLSNSKFIEIGAHTINHPHLSSLKEEEQRQEIFESKKTIEKIIQKPVTTFSYPFGSKDDYNNTTKSITKDAGFICACANQRGYVYLNSDLYELPRIIARNESLKEFKFNSI